MVVATHDTEKRDTATPAESAERVSSGVGDAGPSPQPRGRGWLAIDPEDRRLLRTAGVVVGSGALAAVAVSVAIIDAMGGAL